MAFHDETTAQRLINLLSLQLHFEKHCEDILPKYDLLTRKTADLLADPGFHSSGNNHGMFQDLAILYWAVLSNRADSEVRSAYFLLSLDRLREYFRIAFTEEGVHVENTPTYHIMVCKYVSYVREVVEAVEHEDIAFYNELLSRAELYAAHALMPNGTYPPISDTQQKKISTASMERVFEGQTFEYAASQGLRGVVPSSRTLVLPSSGYAIYRSAWGDDDATFAFFSAAYNADYHKHSDDLSLFLYSRGKELITESGPYSYDYSDPLSKYAYSQFAHNSLIVDGRSLPRTDARRDRVKVSSYEEREDGFTVVAENARFADVIHERSVEIRETDGVPDFAVEDFIRSNNHHSYTLLWNLGAELDVALHGQGFELFAQGRKLMDLHFTAGTSTRVSLHQAEMNPRPLGWRFPKFGEAKPSKVVAIHFASSDANISTSIRLSDFTYRDRRLCANDINWSRFAGEVPLNYLFSRGESQNGKRHLAVVFSAIQERGDFTYNYKATVDQLDTSALYILDDFGDQGAYYHSDHRSEAIFRSVQKLIDFICSEQTIERRRVAMVGSSKGGAAALMHGAAFGAGRIIVGAPQTRIGSFLSAPHPNMVEFIAGGSSSEDVDYLDSILFDKMAQLDPSTKVSILVGQNDHHLPNHVLPLMEFMGNRGLPTPALTVLPDLSHADIGSVYRHYLAANLEQWTRGSDEEALPYTLSSDQTTQSIRLKIYAPEGTQLSYRLFKGKDVVRRRSFSGKDVVVFDDLSPGRYRVRVYTRAVEDDEAVAFTTRWVEVKPQN